jgi:hypothetical protein
MARHPTAGRDVDPRRDAAAPKAVPLNRHALLSFLCKISSIAAPLNHISTPEYCGNWCRRRGGHFY